MTDYHIFHIDYPHLSSKQWATLTHARSEAAKLWNRMIKLYKWGVKRRIYFTEARFKAHFKRRFALAAQTIQAIIEKFFAARRATQTKRQRGDQTARYPSKRHRYFNVTFKSQGIRVKDERLVLTMGRKQQPLSLPLPKNQDGLKAQCHSVKEFLAGVQIFRFGKPLSKVLRFGLQLNLTALRL